MNDTEEDYAFYSVRLKLFESIVPTPAQKPALELIETNIDSSQKSESKNLIFFSINRDLLHVIQ